MKNRVGSRRLDTAENGTENFLLKQKNSVLSRMPLTVLCPVFHNLKIYIRGSGNILVYCSASSKSSGLCRHQQNSFTSRRGFHAISVTMYILISLHNTLTGSLFLSKITITIDIVNQILAKMLIIIVVLLSSSLFLLSFHLSATSSRSIRRSSQLLFLSSKLFKRFISFSWRLLPPFFISHSTRILSTSTRARIACIFRIFTSLIHAL